MSTSATDLPLRLDGKLREEAETVLEEGETFASFVEASVRETIQRRQRQSEFIADAMASRDEARRTGVYHAAADVHARLAAKLDEAKRRLSK